MNILEALADIQANLKAPKSNYNAFSKFNYRSCEDILESVKPLLIKNKLVLVLNDEMLYIGDRYYVKATATLSNLEKETVEAVAYAQEGVGRNGMTESQTTGATSSYARKYALNGLFCIDDTKDADVPIYATSEQINQIKELVSDIPKLLSHYKLEKIEDLTKDVAQEIINKKKRTKKKN